jgi:hypothetical protein
VETFKNKTMEKVTFTQSDKEALSNLIEKSYRGTITDKEMISLRQLSDNRFAADPVGYIN